MLNDLVGRRVGIVRELQILPPGACEPTIWIAATEMASTDWAFGHQPGSGGGGAGLTRQAAADSALGESAERYAAASQKLRKIGLRAAAAIPGAERWRKLSPENFPVEPSDASWGWIDDRRGVPVPAALVFVPYAPAEGEFVPFVSISTGLAAAPSLHEAETRAFLEVVERDAVARFWYGRRGGRRIPFDTAPKSVVDAFADAQVRMSLYALEAAGDVPTAFAVLECVGRSRRIVAVGTASRSNWADAAGKALIEAAHSRVYVTQLLESPESEISWPPQSFQDHAAWPSRRPAEWVEASAFLNDLESGAPPVEIDVESTMASMQESLHSFDLTTVDLRAAGVHVAKIVSPELLPLTGNDVLRHTNHPRWPRDANPWPHPMP